MSIFQNYCLFAGVFDQDRMELLRFSYKSQELLFHVRNDSTLPAPSDVGETLPKRRARPSALNSLFGNGNLFFAVPPPDSWYPVVGSIVPC